MTKSATQTARPTTNSLSLVRGILQRKCACGNHTVSGKECVECGKRKSNLQAKLKMGLSNDPLEQEADRIADQVLATPAHPEVSNAPFHIQRFAGYGDGHMDRVPVSVERVLANSGSPLESSLRHDMEQRFGHDFSRVRLHFGTAAEQSALEVNANAYTVGHNIVFGAAQFAPSNNVGRRLIAHELTHVVQQSRAAEISVRQNQGNSDLNQSVQEVNSSAYSLDHNTGSDARRDGSHNYEHLPLIGHGRARMPQWSLNAIPEKRTTPKITSSNVKVARQASLAIVPDAEKEATNAVERATLVEAALGISSDDPVWGKLASLWMVRLLLVLENAGKRGQLLALDRHVDQARGGVNVRLRIAVDAVKIKLHGVVAGQIDEAFFNRLAMLKDGNQTSEIVRYVAGDGKSIIVNPSSPSNRQQPNYFLNAPPVESHTGKELKLGVVSTDEGVNLRQGPSIKTISIKKIPLNTRVLITKEQDSGWYQVVLEDGSEGYVAQANVSTDMPDAASRLYRILPGESALALVKKFYKENATQWGQDERFFVNVLVFANRQHGRLGIYKEIPEGDWDTTKTKANSQIWIPSVAFAQTLKGKVSSGSLSYEIYRGIADAAYAVGEFVVGAIAFVAGLLHGALESVWDTLVGLIELVPIAWKILKSLFTLNLLTDIKAFFSAISGISFSDLAAAGIDWLDKKWNDPSLLSRWHFRGWIVGYAIAELLMLFFTEGILTAVKAVSKAGKFGEIIAKLPKLAKFLDEAKAATKGIKELEVLRTAAKTLAAARDWAVKVLKVPAKIIGDLTLEAIERLKKLPAWMQARFSELAEPVKCWLLGCASPCKVDLNEIIKYFSEIEKAEKAGKILSSEQELFAALSALSEPINLELIKSKLARFPGIMGGIREAGFTAKDFGALTKFLTNADKLNPETAYRTFTLFVTRAVPSKIGNDIGRLNKVFEAMVAAGKEAGKVGESAAVRSLKGSMFESFAATYLPEFMGKSLKGVEFAPTKKLKLIKSRTPDFFIEASGELWDLKTSLRYDPKQLTDYLKILNHAEPGIADKVKSINYLFSSKKLAEANSRLNDFGALVHYVDDLGKVRLL